MSWNNIIPWWILGEECPECGQRVKSRDEYPGHNCTDCGGDCIPLKQIPDKEERDELLKKFKERRKL